MQKASTPLAHIPETEFHYRVYDQYGRVRAYAYDPRDFGPIPKGWKMVPFIPYEFDEV